MHGAVVIVFVKKDTTESVLKVKARMKKDKNRGKRLCVHECMSASTLYRNKRGGGAGE